MPAIGVYDAKKVSVMVGGVRITGFAQNSFVTAKKDEEAVKTHVSAQGDVGVAINNNSLGTITIKLNQTSPSINYLVNLANTNQMVDAWVYSNNDVVEKGGGTQAQVIKTPEISFGSEITERDFEIKVFDYTQE